MTVTSYNIKVPLTVSLRPMAATLMNVFRWVFKDNTRPLLMTNTCTKRVTSTSETREDLFVKTYSEYHLMNIQK